MTAARAEGQRYCPLCGGDWAQADVPRELPPAFRSAPGVDAFADDDPDDTDPNVPGAVSAREAPRVAAARAPAPTAAPTLPEPPADPPAPSSAPPVLGPVTIALLVGLGLAVAVGFFHERLFPPASAPAPRPRPAPPPKVAVAAPPRPAPPAAPTPPPLPSPADAPDRRAEAVEQAIGEALRDADRATRVEVRARVEGGVAFLTGAVDSRATLDRVAAAAAEVFGVRAVDTRGVEMRWRRHTVAPGDTLVGLARRYYGDATAWPRIWQANADLAHGPAGIRAGTVLVIPTGEP